MELDEAAQREVLRRVAKAAAARGLQVAPIGSVYFLFEGVRSLKTKDLDAIVHGPGGPVAGVEALVALGRDLGEAKISEDKALVKVRIREGDQVVEIDLLRGRSASKGGFLPRELLEAAARRARKEGNVLLYPVEFVILLKAEAAVDREGRAAKGDRFAEENRKRAEVFRQDVYRQVQARMDAGGLDEDLLREGIRLLKRNRRAAVAALLEAASGGALGRLR